jgi:hypothetical protein
MTGVQGDLFARAHARARRFDPLSSHEAARRVENSGKAGAQRIVAGAAILANPGCTAAEIARRISKDALEEQANYRMLGRRLPELRENGLARNGVALAKCSVTGKSALTWWPV